jgi:hypothetical protein
MRKLDYEVVHPGPFLRETLMACPRTHQLKLEGALPAALAKVCDRFLSAGPSWLRWLKPKCYVIAAGDADAVLDVLCAHARALRLRDLSLTSAKGTRIWFEAPHFGDSSTLFVHDQFPEPLLARLVANGSIKLCQWEVKSAP